MTPKTTTKEAIMMAIWRALFRICDVSTLTLSCDEIAGTEVVCWTLSCDDVGDFGDSSYGVS